MASSFLLHDHPQFQINALLDRSRRARNQSESQALSDDILRAIEPFNVAGLGDARRRNWYPANAEDLLRAAPKLGATREDIAALLERCGFEPPAKPS